MKNFTCNKSILLGFVFGLLFSVTGISQGTLEVRTGNQTTGYFVIPNGDNSPSVDEKTEFGNLSIGATKTTYLYLRNTHATNSIVFGASPTVSISGPNASEFNLTIIPFTGSTITAGSYVNLRIEFNPSSLGLKQATISVNPTSGTPSPYTFDIQGNGINTYGTIEVSTLSGTNGEITLNGDTTPMVSSRTDFSNVTIGAAKTNYLYLKNVSTNPGEYVILGNPAMTLSGPDASQFSLSSAPINGSNIADGLYDFFQIIFTPTTVGLKQATITVNLANGTPTPFTFDIQGTGSTASGTLEVHSESPTGTIISNGDVTPSTTDKTDYEDISIGASKRTYFYLNNIANNDGEYIIYGSPSITFTGTDATEFSFVGVPAPGSIHAGLYNDLIYIDFNPTSAGIKNATVNIFLSIGSPAAYTFDIQGNGISTYGTVEVNTSPNTGGIIIPNGDVTPSVAEKTDYEDVSVGATKSGVLYIKNISTNPGEHVIFGNPSISITGPGATEFRLSSPPPAGSSLGGGLYDSYYLYFEPTSAGLKQATVSITITNGTPITYTYDIQGNAINTFGTLQVQGDSSSGPVITNGDTTPSPADFTDFEDVSIGDTKEFRFYEVNTTTNPGEYLIFNSGHVNITGVNASEFSVSNDYGGSLSNSALKFFKINFNPMSEGLKNATVTINLVNGTPLSYTFDVQGNARVEDITISGNGNTIPNNNTAISNLDFTDFGEILTGSSLDHTFIITNTGAGISPTNLVFDAIPIEFEGMSAAQFSVIAGPAPSEVLAIGASRNLTIRFSPAGGGIKTASIKINLSTGYPSPYSFNIAGFGIGVPNGDNLISYGALWKYHDGLAPPVNWMTTTYDDSTWDTGYGSFTTSSTNYTARTVLSSSTRTAYFRHEFNVADPTLANNLALLLEYEEGIVVYINGTEMFRSYMPAGAVNHFTFAYDNPYAASYYSPTYINFPNTLVAGINTIAVEVHPDATIPVDFNAELNFYDIVPSPIADSNLFSRHWYNTKGSLFDFSTEPPSISKITVSGGEGIEGSSTWSDPFNNGELEVFLDLNSAYDQNGNALTMVDNSPAVLAMDFSRSQMAFFLPFPGSNLKKLYVIHGANADEQDQGDLNYSVLNSTTKKFESINNPLISLGMTEGMTAINSGSDCGMWIVALANEDNNCTADCEAELRLWKVDKDNLLTPNKPPTQVIPLPFNIPGRGERATIRFSQQDDEIAIALEGRQTNDNLTVSNVTSIDGGIYYASWDPMSASVGSWTKVPISSTEDTYTGYDVEFSPDGSKLFYGTYEYLRSRGPLHVHTLGDNYSTQLKYLYNGDEITVNGSGIRLDPNNQYMYIVHKNRTTVLYRLKNPNTVTSTLDAQLERVATSDPETLYGHNLSQQSLFYPPCLADIDSDSVIGESERDTDNDGISDALEDYSNNRDTDGDGAPDYLDLDSDNDGIPDLRESGLTNAQLLTYDPSVDAVVDTAVGQNGFEDTLETGVDSHISNYTPIDTDLDGIPNYLDLDSDNDSILDVDESGNGDLALDGYDIDGDGFAEGNDTDEDGIIDRPDENDSAYGTPSYPLPLDSDGDSIPDYMEPDSDNDGTFDMESNINFIAAWDTDNDGILDDNTDNDDDGVADTIDQDLINYGTPRYCSDKLHIEFDGVNDYITTPIDLSGKNEVTISGWFKRSDLVSTTETGLFGQIGVMALYVKKSGSSHSVNMRYGGNISSYGIGAGFAGIDLNNLYWHHAASSFKNGEIKLYIDGILVVDFIDGIGNTSLSIDNTKAFNIGGKASSTTSDAFFTGSLDDVRVFDKALSEEQVKQMIYQEIYNEGGNVRGTIIPKDIINYSDDSIIPWAQVLGYYDIKDVRGDVLFDVASGLNPGKLYNIKTYNYQTAPLPYETQPLGDGQWTNSNNWLHGDVWDITQLPTNDAAIIQIHDDLETAASHDHLGLFIDTGKTLTVGDIALDDQDFEINNSWYLQLDGTIDLQDDSQLIQSVNSDLVTDVDGKILRRQEGNTNHFWYNYWASPVGANNTISPIIDNNTAANNPNNTPFTINSIQDSAGDPFTFTSSYNVLGQISRYWLYTYQNGLTYYDWNSIDENTNLAPGIGYTQKGTGNAGLDQQYIFEGKPNNGTILVAADDVEGDDGMTTESVQNVSFITSLIGNPYPSALDADEFIRDNIDFDNGFANPIIQGTILLWEQWAGNSHNLDEYEGGYGYINLTETARAYQHLDIVISDPTNPDNRGIKTPTKFIPVGQAFFVEVVKDGNIEFNNSQRVFKQEALNESVFFRSQENTDSNESSESTDGFEIIRLEFSTSKGATRHFVLGFSENTTDGFDHGYDGGKISEAPSEDMGSILNGDQYVIQAFSPIEPTKVIDLFLNTSGTLNYTLKIDELKNIDPAQDIYLKDNQENIIWDLKLGPYNFTTITGEDQNRFDIIFQSGDTLSNTDVVEDYLIMYVNHATDMLYINGLQANTKDISLINVLGQKIKTITNVNTNQLENGINISDISAGVYVVSIKTDTNNSIDRKIIID